MLKHMATDQHAAAIQSKQLSKQLQSGLKKMEAKASDALIPQLRAVCYLVKQNMPLSSFPKLMELQKVNGAPLSTYYKGHNEVEEMVSALARTVDEKTMDAINKSTFIGVIADESVDIAVFKKLIIYVALIIQGEVKLILGQHQDVPDGKAVTIHDAIHGWLQRNNIPAWKLAGFGSDGAAVMMGVRTGVGIRLKAVYKLLVHIHCCAHRLALAVSQAAKSVPQVKKYEIDVKAVYDYHKNSPARYNRLRELEEVIIQTKVTLKEPHSVRWLSLHEAVTAVSKSWPALIASLGEDAVTHDQPIARGLSQRVETFQFVSITCLLEDILPTFTKLSQCFQASALEFEKVQSVLAATRAALQGFLEGNEGMPKVNRLMSLVPNEEGKINWMGVSLTRTDNCVASFETIKANFVRELQDNLDNRFPEDGMEFLRKLHSVISPAIISRSENVATHGLVELADVSDTLSAEIPANVFDRDRALADFFIFKQFARQHRELSVPVFGKLLCTTFQDTYPDFVVLMEMYLVIPLNSASCERGFSSQNIIKTRHRSRLGEGRLDELLRISINGPDFSVFDYYEEAAQHFRAMKDRIL